MRDKDLRQNYISHIKYDEIIVILVAQERRVPRHEFIRNLASEK
jgi:hypothetical protein